MCVHATWHAQVAESGEGFTLSGKALDPHSAAARACVDAARSHAVCLPPSSHRHSFVYVPSFFFCVGRILGLCASLLASMLGPTNTKNCNSNNNKKRVTENNRQQTEQGTVPSSRPPTGSR
jgi:hypothetical protein